MIQAKARAYVALLIAASPMFLFALAAWNGLSRAYEYRRTLLLTALGNQWCVLLSTTALLCGIAFRVPAATKPLFATVALPCILVLFWNTRRLNRLFAASPRLGSWFYFERQDPAFLSRRGINAASPWAWALGTVPIAAILLVELLLQAVEVI